MAKVTRSIIINAPIESVREITDDPMRMLEWYDGIVDVKSDGIFPEVGGEAEFVYKAAGITFSLKQVVLEQEPGKRSKSEFQGMITGITQDMFEPEGEATKYTLDFDYEMPGGGVGKVVDRLVVERMNINQLEASLKNLKALVEG